MKHIVFYSGGIGSYMTAKRVIEEYGKENVILHFTDTKTEDEDLYRFIDESVKLLDVEFAYLADGRDVWEVFFDKRFLGNSRVAPCTVHLKQKLSKKWVFDNFKPEETTLYIGIDWTEIHRLKKVIENWLPFTVKAPMTEPPYLSKEEMLEELKKDGIEIPRLYKYGFSHNNCGWFCVKAGQAHFINLLEKMPDRYKYHEEKEQEIRAFLNADVTILKKTENKTTRPLTLKELREMHEKEPEQIDMFDFGGCGCFI